MSSSGKKRPVRIDATELRPSELRPPVSKSDAQRALVLESLLGRGEPWIQLDDPDGELPSDVRVLRAGLATLTRTPAAGATIDCADGGAPFRILLGQAAVTPGARVELRGTERLGQRPHQPLVEALNQALASGGGRVEWNGRWPLRVRGPEATAAVPRFEIVAKESSQFVTSLLLAAAALSAREKRRWTVALLGTVASEGYIDITLEWLRRAGFEVSRAGPELHVQKTRPPDANTTVPRDWSSAGYLLLLAWKSGGTVWFPTPPAHPDAAILKHLSAVGLTVDRVARQGSAAPDCFRVSGKPKTGLSTSIADCPDLALTLAALATVLPAPSVFRDISILRAKESDRQKGLVELARLGGCEAMVDGDSIRVVPPSSPGAGREFATEQDHRRAMAAATLAALRGLRLELDDRDCVSKSFPAFWQQLEQAGVRLTPI